MKTPANPENQLKSLDPGADPVPALLRRAGKMRGVRAPGAGARGIKVVPVHSIFILRIVI
jgi:hypothetical protein